ncbi:MAG: G5 domain-containing protein [Anaerolineae bacterium]|nr:G5 domain-containing protein [Anaerolineae bacterium]
MRNRAHIEQGHPLSTGTRPVWAIVFIALTGILVLTGCFPAANQGLSSLQVMLNVDNQQMPVKVASGTTVQGLLDQTGVQLSQLDRVDPPGYTVLAADQTVIVTRIREEFQQEELTIPFESQTVQNESLPDQREMIIQTGANGLLQRTYRIVFENGTETSRAIFKETRLVEPKAEIRMVGVQKPFTPYPIPGRLAYLAGGNAWVMQGNTGERKPVVTTADLDGRIFQLSGDGNWLLFTRKSTLPSDQEINTLWMINLEDEESQPIDLRVSNIIHFAGWVPGRGLTITYSTVEPRATAPGWQANNDLHLTSYAPSGMILETDKIIEANYGGAFGWWGTNFAWSPDGSRLAYAQPNSLGLVDFEARQLTPIVDIVPFQTRADWAWVTGMGWSPTAAVLYFSSHIPKPGLDNAEGSPFFDLSAITLDGGPNLPLAEKVGMFGYPVVSPLMEDGSYRVAYLTNASRDQGETGRYWLSVMDRDGSSQKRIFPEEGKLGLNPQMVAWAPSEGEDGQYWLACIYQGNLFLVSSQSGDVRQVTGDGLIEKIDW